jgi:hypothetical protein
MLVAGSTADRKTYWTHVGRTQANCSKTANNISKAASCGLPDGQDKITLSQPHNFNPSTAKNPVDTTGPVCDDKPAGKHTQVHTQTGSSCSSTPNSKGQTPRHAY